MRIEIDMANVKEDSLTEFIVSLENVIPGCKVEIREVFYLDVDDPKAAAILQSLFGGKVEKKEGEKKHRKHFHYTVLTGPLVGREITPQTFKKMFKNGEIAAGTVVKHPTMGELVVRPDGLLVENIA
jgi:hypothetical protein